MSGEFTKEAMEYIISRLLTRAFEAFKEEQEDRRNQFKAGRSLAYYEMLDTLQSELDIHEQDLKEYGLDIDLMKLQ